MNSIGNKKPKCLIIHGFGGRVHEISALAEYLLSAGYEVCCPVLKGHDVARRDMRKATYKEWIESAERELIGMSNKQEEIVIIGFSMGGLIAFNLACQHNIKKIVTINTPIFFWNIVQVARNLAADVKNRKPDHFKRYWQAKTNSPLLAMIQFLRLLSKTKPKLGKISCPLLIIQAEDDDTVRTKSVQYIYDHVAAESKTVRYFPEGGHLILLSPTAGQVMLCVEEFIKHP